MTDTRSASLEQIKPERQRLYGLCVEAVRTRLDGLTADEIAEISGESVLSIRPRVSELKSIGVVADTGTRRKNASGRSATVVRLADPASASQLTLF